MSITDKIEKPLSQLNDLSLAMNILTNLGVRTWLQETTDESELYGLLSAAFNNLVKHFMLYYHERGAPPSPSEVVNINFMGAMLEARLDRVKAIEDVDRLIAAMQAEVIKRKVASGESHEIQ